MAARTPRSSATPEPTGPEKPTPAPAAARAARSKVAAAAVAAPAPSQAAPPVPEASPAAAPVTPPPSVLERLRRNRMGAVLGGLVVAIALGLLLSIFVPDEHLLLALVVLGLAEAVAVGFTVRYLTVSRGLDTQLTAFALTAIGVHLMVTTGMVNQAIGDVGSMVGDLLGQGAGPRSGAGSGLGWDDAVITALATPTMSTGAIVCGLIAAIIAGWGVSAGLDRGRDGDVA